MLKTNVYDMNGKQVGEVELSEAVFGIEPNESVVHDVVKNHLANCRQGTQSALTRAEVSGGGKKPWRQKGTGHARQGSTRAPQWTHGGIVFAPKPRDYSYTLNKKVRRLALKSVLSAKAASSDIVVIDEIKMDEIKTKKFAGFLSAVNADCKALVVTAEVNENVVLSARNIPGVQTTFANLVNVYDILNAKKLVLDKAALAKIVFRDFCETGEEHDAVPFRFADRLTVRIPVAAGRGDAERRDSRAAVGRIAGFGIAAEIADDDCLIDGSHNELTKTNI